MVMRKEKVDMKAPAQDRLVVKEPQLKTNQRIDKVFNKFHPRLGQRITIQKSANPVTGIAQQE